MVALAAYDGHIFLEGIYNFGTSTPSGEVLYSAARNIAAAEAKFNGKVAQRDLRRYHRDGPDVSTKLLLAELHRCALEDASVQDIGSGIGVIDMELADSGVGSATLVEASPAYFDVSRNELARCGSRSIKFVVGDFVAVAP